MILYMGNGKQTQWNGMGFPYDSYTNTNNSDNYRVLANDHVEYSLDSVSVELEIVSISSLDSPSSSSSISRQHT